MTITDDLLECFDGERLYKAHLDRAPSELTAFELLVVTEIGLPQVDVLFEPRPALLRIYDDWYVLVLGTAAYDEYRVYLDLHAHTVLASSLHSDDREPKFVNSSLENFLQFLLGMQKVIDAKANGTFAVAAVREYEWFQKIDPEGVCGWWEPFLSEMLLEAS